MAKRNPIKDQVAIVGIGAAPYGRHSNRSLLDLGLEAAVNAIKDAGIDKRQIDGICGTGMSPMQTHSAGVLSLSGGLGIPELTWTLNGWIGSQIVYAAEAVFAGTCDYCLIVQAEHRGAYMSKSAANDPFRARAAMAGGAGMGRTTHYSEGWMHSGEPYAAYMNWYLRTFGAPREMLGMVAVNNRQWASQNPAAAMREPFTMDDYMNARMIRSPLGLLDMDLPIDAAEAIVITTAERAKDLPNRPVYIHAMSLGQGRVGEFYENAVWGEQAPWQSFNGFWEKSDIQRDDIDIFYPYDGYTPTVIAHTEAAGFAERGEVWPLFQDSWDEGRQKLKLNGRTEMATGGGSMSHGRLSGFNYYPEAVKQLRGQAEGDRQVSGATTALFSIGSFFHDPAAVIFRTE
jgi:acetyl-CoA acetyltransferase